MKPVAHVTEVKRKEVEDVKRLIKQYAVLGIVNLEKLPAANLMKIRKGLTSVIFLKYTKKRLMKIAFDELGDDGLINLKDRLLGIPVLLFSNEDPFKLYQLLKKSKSSALAKAGDVAPIDIVIPAGPTEFTPGPMIGELGAMGIKTSVEGGKISIRSEVVLLKAGQQISVKQADLMSKLKIEPMEIGLNLVLTYQNGEVLERGVLDIDIDMYIDDMKQAVVESLNLAVFSDYITKDSVDVMLRKAVLEERFLGNTNNLLEKIMSSASEVVAEAKPKQETPTEKSEEKPVEAKSDNQEVSVKESEENKEEPEENRKDISGFSDSFMKQTQDTLRSLTDKKLRGDS